MPEIAQTGGADRHQADLKRTAQGLASAPVFGQAETLEQQMLQAQAKQAQLGMGQAFGQQQDLMAGLEQRAAGLAGPSQAQLLGAQQGQQAIVNQMGMTAQAQGGSMAGQQRQAAAQGAAGQMGIMQNTAQLQQQEQLQAQQMLQDQANQIAQMRMQQAQFGTGTAQQANQFLSGQGLQAAQFNQQASAAQMAANREFGMDIVEGAAGAVQGAAMMSDERVKEDIRDGGDDALEAIRALHPVTYRYKHSRYGPADRDTTGIIAQDLEKSPAGMRIVRETEMGKAVDINGGLSLSLAGLAAVVKRLDEIDRDEEPCEGLMGGLCG